MRIVLSTLALLGLAGPALATHLNHEPPGQAAATADAAAPDDAVDLNGKDYAPGQLDDANEEHDINGDGDVNGRDDAPGQYKGR
jgi:hypothetical protein